MLWPALVQKNVQGSEIDSPRQEVRHCFAKNDGRSAIVSRFNVVESTTGEILLSVLLSEFNQNPDIEFWYERTRQQTSLTSTAKLAFRFTGPT